LVLATDRVSPEGLRPLLDETRLNVRVIDDSGSDEFKGAIAMASGLIVRSATTVDRALIEMAPNLEVIGRAGVGVDNIDIDAASERRIAVFNAPDGNTLAAVELTVALMLALLRHVPDADRSIREGRWDRAAFMGRELHGSILGLVGAGRIGTEVARRCHAFGMTALAYDPYLASDRATSLGIRLTDLAEVIQSADVISCHVPLNQETRGLISTESFRSMKKSAVVINVSRGDVVDEDALAVALGEGEIAGAALDVYKDEPLPDDSPLRDSPNLVLTPHLGASTREAQSRVAVDVSLSLRTALIERDFSAAINAKEIAR
jgi:D-3-phosphoglycerate dehydrogenase